MRMEVIRRGIRPLAVAALAAAVLAAGCGSNNSGGSSNQSPAAKATPAATQVATGFPTAAEKAMYPSLEQDFKNNIVPAANKEGQVVWYTCATQDDAQVLMDAFNKVYPNIKVNYVYMVPNDAYQRITAEETSNHVQGDMYSCGGTTSRNLGFQGFTVPYIGPDYVDPEATYWFDTVDADKFGGIVGVDMGGLVVNTKLVPQSHYPKTWWDFVQDPYWTDLIKKGDVAILDPRQPGHGRGLTYGLVRVKSDTYGEKWLQTLAALKPKRITTDTGQAATGEFYAIAFDTLQQKFINDKAPVTILCPDPGCETTATLTEVLKGAPHPDTAKVFADFLLSKPGQQAYASRGLTVARTDVPTDQNRSYQTHPPLFWPDDAAAKAGAEYQKFVNDSKLFDYP